MPRLPSVNNQPLFAITTGDADGVGFEITAKALLKNKFSANFVVFIYPESERKFKKLLQNKFNPLILKTEAELLVWLSQKNSGGLTRVKQFVLFETHLKPTECVQLAAQLSIEKKFDGLITAPMSKEKLLLNGHKQTAGHTEIFKAVSKNKNLFMTFLGSEFNVLLVTDHIGFKKVPAELKKNLAQALKTSVIVAKKLNFRKIGVLGLNPHAGEKGLIGNKEDLFVERTVKAVAKKHRDLSFLFPLPPDAAFMPHIRKKIDLYIALYHDQGLIPFKALHGFNSGVHITSGLNFIRTSVDHGTAKDIYGKNLANPSSMIDAINYAIKLYSNR